MSIFSLLVLAAACGGPEEVKKAPPLEVEVVKLESQTVSLEKEFVAQVYGKVDIPIRARAEGYLEGIHFEEGRPVKQGDLLYTVDPEPFQEGVNQANSELASAKVALTQAESDLARYEPLAAMNAVSQKDLDAAVAQRDAAEAMVAAAEARVRFEGIQLSYTQITSPISGLIGKTEAKVGEFVGRSPNPVILNTVSLIDSVRVEFALSENDYLLLFREYQESGATREADQPLQLILSDGSVYDQPGRYNFINRQIDAASGTILIQSTFPNPEGLIRPGQFARVRAAMSTVDNAVLVPQRAVSELQGQFSVFVVDEENTVQQQQVTIGGNYRDYFVISEGLSAGDQVVFEAIQKVSSGQVVNPQVVEFKSQFEK